MSLPYSIAYVIILKERSSGKRCTLGVDPAADGLCHLADDTLAFAIIETSKVYGNHELDNDFSADVSDTFLQNKMEDVIAINGSHLSEFISKNVLESYIHKSFTTRLIIKLINSFSSEYEINVAFAAI